LNEAQRYEHWRRHMIAQINFDHGHLPTDGYRIRYDPKWLNAAMDMRINALLREHNINPVHRIISISDWTAFHE
jgi:hypothetical protein